MIEPITKTIQCPDIPDHVKVMLLEWQVKVLANSLDECEKRNRELADTLMGRIK